MAESTYESWAGQTFGDPGVNMQDLRLIGVHEGGEHLLFADAEGTRFRVPLDEPLRAAARHHRPSSGQPSAEVEAGHRPREVQALIRAGLTAEEVADRCGWTVDKVRKYEVPILAEREYVAGLARLVRLRLRGAGSQAPPTLAGRVAERLATRGVAPGDIGWDSWREAGSEWTVAVTFPAGGRQRRASWAFDPLTNAVHARDDEARWLSEDDPSAAAVVRDVPVYDIEAEGGVETDPSPGMRTPRSAEPADHDLVATMRQRASARGRRGSRRRPALEPVAAPPREQIGLAEELGLGLPDDVATDVPPAAGSDLPPEAEVPGFGEAGDDAAGDPPTDVAADIAASLEPDLDSGGSENSTNGPSATRRPSRTSVPRWEDVVLGTRTSSE